MKKLRAWKIKNCSDYRGYLYIRAYSPYVKGVIGKDIKLTLWQRIQVLFCGGISVSLHEEKQALKERKKNA